MDGKEENDLEGGGWVDVDVDAKRRLGSVCQYDWSTIGTMPFKK